MTTGLYHPDEFKDNCGFGLIAHLRGEASHRLVRTGIEALTCMTHRGGIAADGRTGDGCGLLLQKPDAVLRRAAQACGAGELTPLYGVGMLMLSQNNERAATARRNESSQKPSRSKAPSPLRTQFCTATHSARLRSDRLPSTATARINHGWDRF